MTQLTGSFSLVYCRVPSPALKGWNTNGPNMICSDAKILRCINTPFGTRKSNNFHQSHLLSPIEGLEQEILNKKDQKFQICVEGGKNIFLGASVLLF